MNREKAIELLKHALTEIPTLRKLRHDNQEFELWRDRVRTVIKTALDSEDDKRFVSYRPIHLRGHSDDVYQEDYLKDLENYETALKSIIQKYELLGTDAKSAATSEQVAIADLPLYLFETIQFHHKVVEASRSCYVAGNYREAILNAFISFIDYTKEISGLDLDGDDLMNKVFSFDYDKNQGKITRDPVVHITELKTQTDRDEQQGFRGGSLHQKPQST